MTSAQNSISDFKNAFNGGTRSNRFVVDIANAFPSSVFKPNNDEKFKIFATNLPQAELGSIQIPYRGRILNVAGDRNYGSWLIGIYDDNNLDNLWRSFHHWMEKMDGHVTHQVGGKTPINDFSYAQFQKTWTVSQLGLNGDVLRTIQLFNCWPEQVSAINLDMSSVKFSTFTVQMAFDYYKINVGI